MKRVLEICALGFLTAILLLPCASAWVWTSDPTYESIPGHFDPGQHPEIIDVDASAVYQFGQAHNSVVLLTGAGSSEQNPHLIQNLIHNQILCFIVHYHITASPGGTQQNPDPQVSSVTVTLKGRVNPGAQWAQVMQKSASIQAWMQGSVTDDGYIWVWWANCPNQDPNQFQLIVTADCSMWQNGQWVHIIAPVTATAYYELDG